MTRQWVDDGKKVPIDKRWVMRCDHVVTGRRCATTTAPESVQPDLARLAAEGWHIARLSGDICPACLAAGAEGNDPWNERKS